MNTQIRDAVFETNSSSSHSLTIEGYETSDFGLGRDELRDGVIRITLMDGFHCDWQKFSDTHSKIAYLLLQSVGGGIEEDYESDDDLVPLLTEKSERARQLVDLIEEATGCRTEFYIDGWASVDHQAYEAGVGLDLFDDPWSMRQFLFSRDSYIQTGTDQDPPPPGFR